MERTVDRRLNDDGKEISVVFVHCQNAQSDFVWLEKGSAGADQSGNDWLH